MAVIDLIGSVTAGVDTIKKYSYVPDLSKFDSDALSNHASVNMNLAEGVFVVLLHSFLIGIQLFSSVNKQAGVQTLEYLRVCEELRFSFFIRD